MTQDKVTKTTTPRDIVRELMAYETGDLEDHEVLDLFQYLVDSGLAYTLRGHYGRTAQRLTDAGLIQGARSRAR